MNEQDNNQQLIQQVFDRVVDHLLTQNAKSFDTEGLCMYRGPNNTKCAVGCLIEDAYYQPKIEAFKVSVYKVRHIVAKSLNIEDDLPENLLLPLLKDLQLVHDHHDPIEWPAKLMWVADNHHLVYNGL